MFGKAYAGFWKKYGVFTGTTDRPGFWIPVGIHTLLLILLGMLSSDRSLEIAASVAEGLLLCVLICPTFAVMTRRLRDAGCRPANLWWILLPVIGWIILIVKWCKPTVEQPKSAEIAMPDVSADSIPSEGYADTLWGESGFVHEPVNNASGSVWGILISIGLIIGGLSGKLVLRGTDSSPALVVVGFLFLIWDIISIFRNRKAVEKATEVWDERCSNLYEMEKKVSNGSETLENPIPLLIKCSPDVKITPDPKINGISMDKSEDGKSFSCNLTQVDNLLSFSNLNLAVAFKVPQGAKGLTFVLRCTAGFKYGVDLPKDVSVIEYRTNFAGY